MLGTLNASEIEVVLKSGLIGRIGCSADGETYVVPISFAYDGQYIYCHTHEGMKTDIMRRNPRICFQVDEMQNMANWRSVIVQGVYQELTNSGLRAAAMQTLLNRYLPIISSATTHLGDHWPFHSENIDAIKGVVFRIAIKEKSGRFENSTQSPHMAG